MLERTWRVLVADDDPAVCALIESVLRKGPFEIVSRYDARSALAAVDRQDAFDMLICDVKLPDISGFDLVTRLRRDERTQTLPILMISGHVFSGIDVHAKNAGADVFLQKPFTVAALRNAVDALLRSN